ncbi:T9SS type B sorting domain-containing protein [Flavobacterium saliperosum]|uniref:Gliding motility-associated C-terminal domain-containing protein n=1 Tax=Flavobacterium saliperosum TaxID=329186 RepID=A0A1G4VRL3_9FLAO|nr:gliding motility-associated C-terminal domain-containing protein [Flavobacterium saliperosum]
MFVFIRIVVTFLLVLQKKIKVRHLFLVGCLLFSTLLFSQNTNPNRISDNSLFKTKIIEDRNGKIITDSVQRALYFLKRQEELNVNNKSTSTSRATLTPAHLCSNSNFEEFEIASGATVLKHFLYTTANPINPTQCVTPTTTANQNIAQYNPNQNSLMASTVPSNYIDEFIGNINAFDQFALKINHKDSYTTSGVVQAKRFKTNNETNVIFNYKAVLQSIEDSGHFNEQPFFKARIINRNGTVVSEFCVIGDPTNCIFTQAPNYEAGSIVLYTQNWQSGSLDISSIPNNEEFTIEFTGARCGLGGHFGYAYIDDLCLLHSDENLQGSIELDPMYQICPTLPLSVCGTFTVPNSGGVAASVEAITLNVYDSTNAVIYSTSVTSALDLTNNTFCFQLDGTNLPDTITGNYNVGVVINYGVTESDCAGTNFSSASDTDANPGWDISFMNCTPDCNFTLQTGVLKLCDGNDDGKEFFDLTTVDTQIIGTQTGLTLSYFTTLIDATNDTNPITNFTNHESYSSTIFARVTKDATCYKIIAFQVMVKNPSGTISGILNVCSGSTTLTASPGSAYLWSNGDTTRDTVVNSVGTYSVAITDSDGCVANASVTILPSQIAVSPTIVVTQPTCFVNTGTITIASPASQYSYDDGVTWTTNNTATNLQVGTYRIKIKTINNCISYSSPINLVPYLSSYPLYTSVNPTNCDDLGSITITTPATEYSFDNGVTWTTSNTASNLPIGTYLIRTKNEFGCISNFNSVVFYSQFLSAPTYSVVAPYCSNLGSITVTTPASEYSSDGGTTWQTSDTFNNLAAGSYIIKIKNAQGCTSPNVYVYLTSFENSRPTYTIDDAGCDKYATIIITTPADFYSFDGGVTWSTNNTLGNLNNGANLQLRVRKGLNCISNIQNAFISSYFRPLPVVTDYSTLICDNLNNGNEPVNLSLYNPMFVSTPSNYTFAYYTSLNGAQNQLTAEGITNYSGYNLNTTNQIIYVVVKDTYGCFSIANLDLTLIPTPVITIDDLYYLCENHTVTVTEDAVFDSYTWSNGSTSPTAVISQAGNYTLTVTESHGSVICSTTKTFKVVLSNPATITNFDILDWTPENNIITVSVTGLGDYEYSLDGINYQNSSTFYDLEVGEHTVYVRDKHGCGVVADEVYLLIHPKFFTPNGDGYNDFWRIKFSEKESDLTVKIFNRYGKLLKQLGNASEGWDGTYLGVPVPSDDYWFVVTRKNGKEHRGHFTLKR